MNQNKNLEKYMKTQILIGITGGIATGKSTVANYLKSNLKLKVINADVICHKILKENTTIIEKIKNYFGEEVIFKDMDSINRKYLGEIISNNSSKKTWLEHLLHPIIKENILEFINDNQYEEILIIELPLLFEANFTDICSQKWVVYCSNSEQERRLVKRDNISIDKARLKIRMQWEISQKLKLANLILDNNSKEDSIWKNKIKIFFANLKH